MDRLGNALSRHQRVGLDSSIFIYHFEGNPRLGMFTTAIIKGLTSGEFLGATSSVTLMELIVQPLQTGRTALADRYEALLQGFPNLSIVSVDYAVARRAGELRAAFQLRPADALQVAACLHHGATAFVTNDLRLRRITDLEIIMLEDFVDH